MSTYQEKLKHPKWQKKRLEILQRDEFKCVHCLDGESTLHVHHNMYLGNIFDKIKINNKYKYQVYLPELNVYSKFYYHIAYHLQLDAKNYHTLGLLFKIGRIKILV